MVNHSGLTHPKKVGYNTFDLMANLEVARVEVEWVVPLVVGGDGFVL